jgi:signal transduction histidine kinase
MTGDHSTGGDGFSDTRLFESFPEPLLAYAGGDGTDSEAEEDTGEGSRVVRAVNPAFESAFGARAGDVIGTPLDEFDLCGGHGERADDERHDTSKHLDADVVGDGPDTEESRDFPTVGPSSGTTLRSLLDSSTLQSGPVVRCHRESDVSPQEFRVRSIPDESADGGGVLLFTEITELTRQRRRLAAEVEQVERIADVVSHDLRNPLEVAEIRLEAARDTGDDVHFEKVAGALDRIERIVSDVLAAGSGRVEPTDAVSLEDVAEAAWDTVDTADAELVLAPDLPTVRGDPDRLQQLFENLFRNSVEHGSTSNQPEADDSVEHGSTGSRSATDDTVEQGDSDVSITVEPIPDGFAVADDGPGIPEDVRERVFEAGYSTAPDNSGLGLSIVRRIATEHGWQVSLGADRGSDADGGGARFEFTDLDRADSGPDVRDVGGRESL